MKTLPSFLLLGCGLALFSGCQNPYTKSYTTTMPPGAERYLRPHTGTPEIQPVTPSNLIPTVAKMERRGYIVIGHAAFQSDAGDFSDELRAKAQEVQADMVLASAVPAGVRQEVNDQMTYDPNLYLGSADAGSVGRPMVMGSGRGAIGPATPGAQTGNPGSNLEVRTIAQFKYGAIFLRQRAFVLGANVGPLAGAQAPGEAPGSGALVVSVIEDSPAARAGVQPGDIITAVEGATFAGLEEYQKLVNARAGSSTHITLSRRGAELTVQVLLNSLPPGL